MLSLLLVGYGNMGGAMLARWQEKSPAEVGEFFVISPNITIPLSSCNVSNFTSLEEFPCDISPDIIVFAVKPQQLADILPEYKKRFGIAPVYLSIAAGKTLKFFAEHLGNDAKIIRTMPNTPALIGKAVTALCANENVAPAQQEIATALMQAIGISLWVAEKDMNAVTALSGSGPAYVFLFLEALTKAGISVGLAENVAKTLALEMLHGSIHLAAKSSESYEKLRENVTSKGGTTQAALSVLMHENALEKLLQEAIAAAAQKAEILAK
jgi:pyrroline-5-carboxylate reductase